MKRVRVGISLALGEFDGISFHIHKMLKEGKDFETLQDAAEYFENLKTAILSATERSAR